jgi:hypothetical protein
MKTSPKTAGEHLLFSNRKQNFQKEKRMRIVAHFFPLNAHVGNRTRFRK